MADIQQIHQLIESSIEVKKSLLTKDIPEMISSVAELIIKTFKEGHKLLICGNGGSAADSQHFSAELVGRFMTDRDPFPSIALSTDTSLITAWSNDHSFETIFSRQVEALGQKGDILFTISTSGNSKNCIEALTVAKKKGLITISLLGRKGGRMKEISDHSIIVPDERTWHIQESHITIIHILCHLIEMGSKK
ncbi:MAG: D-sedoheptulose 7-phosphate isomerase [Spirochaetes bacterium]|nr:D-sedoheptulose 7-phosphate isomerase [Spirochaetota bacterium]